MTADARVCEGSTGLLHTLAFTALLTWSPGVEQSQHSQSWGHCCSQNPLFHPKCPAPSPQPQACPILCPFLTPSQSHSSQFSKSQCKPGSYQVFMKDPCHIVLAKWTWKCLPVSSLRVWVTEGFPEHVSIKYLHVIKVTQGNRRVSVMWNFCSSLPQGSVQFSSVQSLSRVWLCNPMNHSTPGLPVHQQIPEFTQPHIHWVSDAIQPSHPLASPSPRAPNPSQNQSLFQWVNSSHEVAKVLEFQL